MKILKKVPIGIPFMEILLNEMVCQGTLAIPLQLVKQAGGVNRRLKAKQKYELILRIAKESSVLFIEGQVDEQKENYIFFFDNESEKSVSYEWQTDCYIIGKYSNELRESGFFDEAVKCVIDEAEKRNQMQQAALFLEEMIKHGEKYYIIDDAVRPILIYKGDPVCHNVLNVMAEQLGNALEEKGFQVIYFDCQEKDLEEIVPYMYQRFQAIIGVQTYMFTIKCHDKKHYLHEYIYGPKYNFIFDHPIFLPEHILNEFEDCRLMTHDQNYIEFAKKYYGRKLELFPPAGIALEMKTDLIRKYDITFIGAYGDYRKELKMIYQMPREKRFLANHYLMCMKNYPELTAEEAFEQTLRRMKIRVEDDVFLNLLREMRRVVSCVMFYYREKVMDTILSSGLQIDVFGNCWKECILKHKYVNLICHTDTSALESVMVWKQSKLSLNVMSWHKAGFTERMAGIMLAGAVLVTDATSYLRGRYGNEDMLIFRLKSLEELPERINEILSNERKRSTIAQNGKEKTEREHTWKKRAEQFIDLLERNRK